MRKLALALVVLLLAVYTHSRSLTPSSSSTKAEINARGEKGAATLTLADGEVRGVRSLHVAPDVISWIDPATGEAQSVPASRVASVRFTDRVNSVIEGIGAGIIGGGGMGVLVGLGSGGEYIPASSRALIGGIIGGGVEIISGSGIGAIQQSRTVYTTPSPERTEEP